MIYITGDMHGDLSRWKAKKLKKLKKRDTLIICGDFGFLWTGNKQEQKILKWIGKRAYRVLFVDGCYENFSLLNQYEVSEWAGGKVRVISGNLMQLMRGEIYEIEGQTVFAFGGGDLPDQAAPLDADEALGAEQPTKQETGRGLDHLKAYQDSVDLIVTHDAPIHIKHCMDIDSHEISFISNYFEVISKICSFQKWFFGKYHKDKQITSRYHSVFQDIVPVTTKASTGKGK